jgi:lysophosphatidate acyltransferase
MGRMLASWARLVIGFVIIGTNATITLLVCALLLPFRVARIKACNYFGKVTGPAIMKLSGCPLTIDGWEHLDRERPAIYVSNHTSIVDVFLAIWLSPIGTVGVAKREVVWYPFFGQLYLLSGHLRIDRGQSAAAKESLAKLGKYVRDHRLSIYIWPEGTRSASGHLLPFKKGIFHLAKQTGLPVVPVVVEGAHEAWVKGSLQIAPVTIRVTVLPAIDTSSWQEATADAHVEDVWRRFRDTLPERQRPAAA